jgi:hypothetical protein
MIRSGIALWHKTRYYTLHMCLLYKSKKTIQMFFGKFADGGDNTVNDPSIYNVEGTNMLFIAFIRGEHPKLLTRGMKTWCSPHVKAITCLLYRNYSEMFITWMFCFVEDNKIISGNKIQLRTGMKKTSENLLTEEITRWTTQVYIM